MKKLLATLALVLTFGIFTSMAAMAQENDTMTTVEETSEPDTLELPEDAAPEGRENAQQGLDTANEAREKGREFGQERAEKARERGQEARERGQENRQRSEGPRGSGPNQDRNPR